MELNRELVWGITLLFAVTIICITVILIFIFSRIPKEYGSTLRDALEKIELLKLSTILIIIMATTYLTILGELPDGVVAIFSGVSGYVLGTVRRTDGQAGGTSSSGSGNSSTSTD